MKITKRCFYETLWDLIGLEFLRILPWTQSKCFPNRVIELIIDFWKWPLIEMPLKGRGGASFDLWPTFAWPFAWPSHDSSQLVRILEPRILPTSPRILSAAVGCSASGLLPAYFRSVFERPLLPHSLGFFQHSWSGPRLCFTRIL